MAGITTSVGSRIVALAAATEEIVRVREAATTSDWKAPKGAADLSGAPPMGGEVAVAVRKGL